MRLAGCEPPADILDAACGYGRHSRVLAGAGYRVVGLDRSPVLLAEARRRSEGDEWPRWVEGDYRELPFAAERFDAVVNLFTSFGFFGEEGDLQALREFRRVLRPGRALVLETMHRDLLMAIFREQDWEELPDGGVRLERRTFDPVAGTCEVGLTYWPKGREPVTVEYRLRVYTASELKRLAREAGFAEIEFYADPEGGPVSRETRLILVAKTP
jgi:ubiquinone/menaquinone biosynthesis C-methylase UbiE